jgi:hypothetical protein
MTPAELAKAVPELKRLELAENQDLLPQILKRAGAAVAAFFDNFPNTACSEQITSVMEGPGLSDATHHEYNYVAFAPADAGGHIREFRTDAKGQLVQPKAGREIITVGFIASSIDFYPNVQPDSRFRYLGREVMDKRDTYVVIYAQRPGVARQASTVHLNGRSGILFMQGVAWIDPVSFRILRLRTDIQMPDQNVGLLRETTEVLYSEVSFREGGKTLWLPREVTVTGQIALLNPSTRLASYYDFRNQHRYSGYRLFLVDVESKSANP